MTRFVWILIVALCPLFANAEISFDKYFEARTLRVDFTLAGNYERTEIFMEQMKKQGEWAGSHKHLVDEANYGNFRYRLKDKETGEVLFSRGFSSLFQEWQTTPEAKKLDRSYYHVALMPYPKQKVQLIIEMRTWEGGFKELLALDIDPKDYFITEEKGPDYSIVPIMENGPHEKKVDLVFLAEGYQGNEMDKFQKDIKRLTDYLFAMAPYSKHKNDFNLYAVLVPSAESGTDVPGKGIYKSTAFNSHFFTFDEERYLTSKDLKAIHDAAAGAVYDQVFVLVNSTTYGGGGFYNYLTLSTVDNERSPQVFVHEFGHGFAGLADEYYSSSVAYEEFYNLKVEPWEPNITTLVDFDSKWKTMIADSIPQPTPRIKKYDGVVGLFEGGGYTDKGIYSPVMDCRMKTNEAPGFCPVCCDAIERTIRSYCE